MELHITIKLSIIYNKKESNNKGRIRSINERKTNWISWFGFVEEEKSEAYMDHSLKNLGFCYGF